MKNAKNHKRLSSFCLPSLMASIACSACGADGPKVPVEELEQGRRGLYGEISAECSSSHADLVRDAHSVGQRAARTPEFEACFVARMTNDYLPCLTGGGDPYASASISVQRTYGLSRLQSSNTADLEVDCVGLDGGAAGRADVGCYGQDVEEIKVNTGTLDDALAGGIDDADLGRIAGIIWHEALHQQGYMHSENDNDCGYSVGYTKSKNSANYMATKCMNAATLQGRVVLRNAADEGKSFVVGIYRKGHDDFGPLENADLQDIIIPPATELTYCAVESPGAGDETCSVRTNKKLERTSTKPGSNAPKRLTRVEVRPVLLAYDGKYYGGAVLPLSYGVHQSSTLTAIGTIESLFVPAGIRVRACRSAGWLGTGIGCKTYDDSHPVLFGFDDDPISFLEVIPVVTGFSDQNLYGRRESFSPGTYLAREKGLGGVGNNDMESIVVPPGLRAQVCVSYDSSGGPVAPCQDTRRSLLEIRNDVQDQVGYINVDYVENRKTLTVAKNGNSGRVRSVPIGINCGLGCQAGFHGGGLVRLVPYPSNSTDTTDWSGCDKISDGDCIVTMSSARSVTATFRPKEFNQACYDDCLGDCVGESLYSTCVPLCTDLCTF